MTTDDRGTNPATPHDRVEAPPPDLAPPDDAVDAVDAASMDSFPASDPPSFWAR